MRLKTCCAKEQFVVISPDPLGGQRLREPVRGQLRLVDYLALGLVVLFLFALLRRAS